MENKQLQEISISIHNIINETNISADMKFHIIFTKFYKKVFEIEPALSSIWYNKNIDYISDVWKYPAATYKECYNSFIKLIDNYLNK